MGIFGQHTLIEQIISEFSTLNLKYENKHLFHMINLICCEYMLQHILCIEYIILNITQTLNFKFHTLLTFFQMK
jgi:hypothetical protein